MEEIEKSWMWWFERAWKDVDSAFKMFFATVLVLSGIVVLGNSAIVESSGAQVMMAIVVVVLGLLNWINLDSTIAAVASSKKDQPENKTEVQKKLLDAPFPVFRGLVAIASVLTAGALLYGIFAA
jgi:hypothetical protein